MAAINNFIDFDNLTYCGKEAQDIFAQDIYNLDLWGYGIKYLDGVKGKVKLYSADLGSVLQEYTCPFTPDGKASMAESYIEPVALKVNLEECYDQYWGTWMSEQTSVSLRGGIPQTFANWFFDRLRKEMSKEYQEVFWAGNTEADSGETREYIKVTDGVLKLISDSDATEVSGATLTVDNVLEQIEAVVMKGLEVAGNAGVSTENYKIFVNYQDARLLEVALGKSCCPNSTSAVFSNFGKENGKIYVYGFEVVPTMQPKNSIIFVPANNLVLGFDTMGSQTEYKLIDMRETTGDNMFRVIAITNIAVGVVAPEIAVYSIG